MKTANFSAELNAIVDDYKNWAKSYPAHLKAGEWEDEYPNWSLLESTFFSFFENASSFSEKDIENIFFTIARDINGYKTMDFLLNKINIFIYLASKSVASNEVFARYQFADYLGFVEGSKNIVVPLLLKFHEDEDESVRKVALMSLNKLQLGKTQRVSP